MNKLFGVVLGMVLAAAAIAITGVGAQAESGSDNSYEYQIRIPRTTQTCDQEANQLALRFQAATGIQPTGSTCAGVVRFTADKKEYTLYSLRLAYTAKQEAGLYSADFGAAESFGMPGEGQGAYGSYDACLAAMDAQKQIFETQVGLQAVAVTCLPGRYSYAPNYVLRLDGFGKPLKRLRVVEFKFLGNATPDVLAQIDALFLSLGGVEVYRFDGQQLLYAPDTFGVNHDELGRLPALGECTSQISAVQALYAKLGSQSELVFCLALGTGYSLEAVHEGSYFLSGDMGSGHGRYLSYEECASDLARIDYGNTNYVGGICRASDFADGQFELEMYSRL